MGGGLTFLSKKSFNPSNWSNQRRVWEATQNSESERRRIVEREAQIKREHEEEELARVVGGEEEGGRKALGFMYDGGKIPGLLKKERNNNGNNQDDDEHETKRDTNSGGDENESNLFQRQPGDDDAAAAFRAMLAQGASSADNAEGQLDESNHHVTTDLQTNIAAEDDTTNTNNANETKDNRTKLEKAVGRGINAGSGVTLSQQMERFPMLKGAPMVIQQKQKNTGGDGEKNDQADLTGMNFKPLGQVLRNVQCMACKQWGHVRGERECELSGWDPFRMNAPAAAMATTTAAAVVAPNSNMTAADTSTAVPLATLRLDHDKMKEDPIEQKPERKHKKRRKGDRHERKKKSKKHKRRRRERSPSNSYSSYDSNSSSEERYKKRNRDYSSDDSDSRRQSRKGRRKKSSRR